MLSRRFHTRCCRFARDPFRTHCRIKSATTPHAEMQKTRSTTMTNKPNHSAAFDRLMKIEEVTDVLNVSNRFV